MNQITAIPGFADAVLRERLIREAAFLPVSEAINGFRVKPMTLTHYTVLRMMNSPLFPPFREAAPHDLIAFLWIVSEEHSTAAGAFEKFMDKCSGLKIPKIRIFDTPKRWARRYEEHRDFTELTAAEARKYVEEALMDMPPSEGRAGYRPEYFSDPACICALLGREYGYSVEQVMNMRLKCIFQFINEIKTRHTPENELMLFNPLSGRVINNYLMNANRKN